MEMMSQTRLGRQPKTTYQMNAITLKRISAIQPPSHHGLNLMPMIRRMAIESKALLIEIKIDDESEGGAGDETRTRDIQLGRLALYQLSYSRSPAKDTSGSFSR